MHAPLAAPSPAIRLARIPTPPGSPRAASPSTLLAALALAVSCVALAASTAQPAGDKVLRAESLEIVDRSGAVVCSVGSTGAGDCELRFLGAGGVSKLALGLRNGGNPCVLLNDSKGRTRLLLVSSSDDAASIIFLREDGRPRGAIRMTKEQIGLELLSTSIDSNDVVASLVSRADTGVLACDTVEGRRFQVLDPVGVLRGQAGVDDSGRAALMLHDENGSARLVLQTDRKGQSTVEIRSAIGEVVDKLPK